MDHQTTLRMDQSPDFFRVSLHLLRELHSQSSLSLPMYLVAKELLLKNDNDILNLLVRYGLISVHDSQFDHFCQLLKEKLLGKMCVILQRLFDNTYCIEEAHIHANNAFLENGMRHDDYKDRKNLIYGEIEFDSYVRVLQIATNRLECRDKFVDLGHGCGKAVCITASLYDFKEFIGIELIHNLHEISVNLIGSFQDTIGMRHIENPKFTLLRGSFLNITSYDWTDADLVLANSTCFNEELMFLLTNVIESMKVGARIITFTHEILSKYFKTIYKETITVSWGFATVFIAERIYIENVKNYSIASVENSMIDPDVDVSDDYVHVSSEDLDQYYSNQDNSFFSIGNTTGSYSKGDNDSYNDTYDSDNSDDSDSVILT